MLYKRPENADSHFVWTDFQSSVNNVTSNNVGNLIQRVLAYIWKNKGGKIPKFKTDSLKEVDQKLIEETLNLF